MRNHCVSLRNHWPKGHHPLRTSVFLRIGALLRRNYARLRKIRKKYASPGGGNWPPPRSLRILRIHCVFCVIFLVEGMLRSFTHITQFYAYISKLLKKKRLRSVHKRRRPRKRRRRRRRREQNDKLMSGRRETSPECHGTNMVSV